MQDKLPHVDDNHLRTVPQRADQPPGSAPQPLTHMAQGEDQSGVPRMPHERDESADSQAHTTPPTDAMLQAAAHDIEQGHQDTSQSLATDEAYHRVIDDLPNGKPANGS